MNVKECISRRFFGIKYNNTIRITGANGIGYKYDMDDSWAGYRNCLINVCKFYNISEFINDERTIESGDFSQDDLDALEALDIVSSISNVKALRKYQKNLLKMRKK